jgi:hypothetical protein
VGLSQTRHLCEGNHKQQHTGSAFAKLLYNSKVTYTSVDANVHIAAYHAVTQINLQKSSGRYLLCCFRRIMSTTWLCYTAVQGRQVSGHSAPVVQSAALHAVWRRSRLAATSSNRGSFRWRRHRAGVQNLASSAAPSVVMKLPPGPPLSVVGPPEAPVLPSLSACEDCDQLPVSTRAPSI